VLTRASATNREYDDDADDAEAIGKELFDTVNLQ
jgi:hypothetical protein